MTNESFRAGKVAITVTGTEKEMGEVTAERVAAQILDAREGDRTPVLWLMAAPSAFSFYRAFVEQCRKDSALADIVRHIDIYQFDDYPVARNDDRFVVTFRVLLEHHLFEPLGEVCGKLTGLHRLELTGRDQDGDIARAYGTEIKNHCEDPRRHVIQVKGIGMDGHWGFHGAETPLTEPPGIIEVPIGSQNVRQQRIDWPKLFLSDADVPRIAYTATVSLFLKADYIIDNVPQATKQYAVLACYGTDEVSGAVPSSALKDHHNAEAVLTRDAAGALLDYRARIADAVVSGSAARSGETNGTAGVQTLPAATLERLHSLWDDPDKPDQARLNCEIMESVLADLGITG